MSEEEVLARLRAMGTAQTHRGPDDAAEELFHHSSATVGLGFVRLSILDLDTGMQPITAGDDGTAIVCNGQIYNYLELRNEVAGETFTTSGDIEVALHLYRKLGPDFLHCLNGMYAGAVLDPVRHRLLLFRDRFGIKPLYYTVTDRGFFFASEIRALLAGSGIRAEEDPELLPVFLSYRYVPGERTLFRGVKRLPPGSVLDLDLRTMDREVRRYWEYSPGADIRVTDRTEAEDRFTSLLDDAVRIRLRSDVEVGSLLSGGVDSSSVASLAAVRRPGMKLFTVGFDDPVFDEAGEVRDFLAAMPWRFPGAEHVCRTCQPESLDTLPDLVGSVEECISLGTILPTDQVCRLAAEHVKVVLTGEGADETFAGYRKFLLDTAAEEFSGMGGTGKAALLRDFPELEEYLKIRDPDPGRRFIQSELLFTPEELSRLTGRRVDHVPFPEDAMPGPVPGAPPLDRLLAMECRSRLPDYVVLRLDRISMRHSLEARTPYLDHRLAELASGLPVELKVNLAERMGKFVCRSGLSRSGIVDRATAFRAKKPFTIPMAAWLLRRGSRTEFVREIFQGGEAGRAGLDTEMVAEVWKSVTSEGASPDALVSGADRAFALMTYCLWKRTFSA